MRKAFLTAAAAVLLVSNAANAGPLRSLSGASSEPTAQTAAQPDSVNVKPTAGKSKRKPMSAEARIIFEIQSHGVYW